MVLKQEIVQCSTREEAMQVLLLRKADFVVVMTETQEPIGNVMDFVAHFPFTEKSLEFLLLFEQDHSDE